MEQLSLLTSAIEPSDSILELPPGAEYFPEFVSAAEERRLLELLDAAKWMPDLKRRVQHYGYRYDYKKRTLTSDDYLGPLPQWATVLNQRLVQAGIFEKAPDQIIVNEYNPGQGIAPHIDREHCFGEVVASLSLAGSTVMDFINEEEHIAVPLSPCSLIALRGPARHVWRHGIAGRRTDIVSGIAQDRARRVSLTFRTTL